MLVGTEAVLNYLKLTEAKHFRIYQGTNAMKAPVFIYEGPGGVAAAQEQFRQWATLNSSYNNPVEYTLTVFPKGKPRGNNNFSETEETGPSVKDSLRATFYLVSPTGGMIPGQQMQQMQQSSINGLGGRSIEELREQWERDQALEDLEDEVEELRNNQVEWQDKANKIIGYLWPIVENKLAGGGQPTAPSLAGVHDEPGQTVDPERIRLNNAIRRLLKTDPKLPEHLEKLAGIAEASPVTYSQLIIMLNSYAL